MAEAAAALRKHPCPECGGDAVWNASKQALGCPYCGHIFPWQPGEAAIGSVIQEHDLVTVLREVPDRDRGWQEKKQTVQCQSCRAIMVFDCRPGRSKLRVLRLAVHRPARGGPRPDHPGKHPAVQTQRGPGP
jgi:ribosomal protein S27E